MKSEARFTLLPPRDHGMVAAIRGSKRRNAIPIRNAQIQEWESEGGTTTPLVSANVRVVTDSA